MIYLGIKWVYKMGIPISEVINNQLLSQSVIDCIPTHCEACGEEIKFTNSLRQIYCPNKYCSLKIAARLESMVRAMKVDGWDKDTCKIICSTFKLKSPFQVFLLEDKVKEGAICNEIDSFEEKIAAICDREKRKVQVWELVWYSGIPTIETTAYKIFKGYNSLSEAYNEIEKFQVPLIADKLGLRNSDTGVMAVNVYNILIEYKDELLFGETQFEILKSEGKTFYIAIDGVIQGFTNKSEYIEYINKRYQGKINAILMNSVTRSVHALVCDGNTSSNKYLTARKVLEKQRAENEERSAAGEPLIDEIIITNSVELISILDKKFGIE